MNFTETPAWASHMEQANMHEREVSAGKRYCVLTLLWANVIVC